MECDKNCSTCQSTCGKVCPVCGATAIGVNTATVLNLTDVEVDINDHFYLCLNGKCNAAYFSDLGTLIEKTEVKVPIWFKSNFFEYIVCYCRKIYLRDVIKAVFSLENPTKEEIIKFLGKDNIESNCVANNPTSKSCDLLFENAIEYAKELKEQQNNEKERQ